MTWTIAIAILLLAGITAWLAGRRRERRRVLAREALRCPLHDCGATLTVRLDPGGHAGRRYLDVTACSLLPTTPYARPARLTHFPDLAPCEPYLCAVRETSHPIEEVPCPRPCLGVLNAAENGPLPVSPREGSAWDLAGQTQPPAIVSLLWRYGV